MPSSSRKSAFQEQILDEMGPPGHEGRYDLDWVKDPSVLGRYAGETEDQFALGKRSRKHGKRSQSRVASTASHEPSSDMEGPATKKKKPQKAPYSRRAGAWEYVEVDEDEAQPVRISIEAEIRRRKKEGLPPLQPEEIIKDPTTTRGTRNRSRDTSGPKAPLSRKISNGRKGSSNSGSPNTKSHTGASPRQGKNGTPSRTSDEISPSQKVFSRDENVPSTAKLSKKSIPTPPPPQPTKRSRNIPPNPENPSKHTLDKSTSRLPHPPLQPAKGSVPSPSALSNSSAASYAMSKGKNKSAPSRLSPVKAITGSQFKEMTGHAVATSSKHRFPSPTQNDTIAPFSSPVAPSGRSARGAQALKQGGAKAKGHSSPDKLIDQEASSDDSVEEEVQFQIVTEIVDGVEVTRAVVPDGSNHHNERGEASSEDSSEEDISQIQITTRIVDGEEIVGVVEESAGDVNGDDLKKQDAKAARSQRAEGKDVPKGILKSTESSVVEPALKELPGPTTAVSTSAVEQAAAKADHGPKVDEAVPPYEAVRQAIVASLDDSSSQTVPTHDAAPEAPSPSEQLIKQTARIEQLEKEIERLLVPADEQIKKQFARIQELEQEVARLEISYQNTLNDNTFLRQSYQDASNKAVAEVRRNYALEEQMTILRGQLKYGLKQKEMVAAAVEKKRESEMIKLRMQNKVLLDQARLTDDDVRRRASAYGKMKYERDQLLSKNTELHEKFAALTDRNEELVDQVSFFRAKQMGVFGSDSEDDDECTDEDDEPELGADDYRSDSGVIRSGLCSDDEDVFTSSQVGQTGSQHKQTGSQGDEGVYRSGLYVCKWREPDPCLAVFDTREAYGRHVEAHAGHTLYA